MKIGAFWVIIKNIISIFSLTVFGAYLFTNSTMQIISCFVKLHTFFL